MHAVYVCAYVYNSGGLRLISVTFLNHSATLLFESESQSSLEPTNTACLAGQVTLGNPLSSLSEDGIALYPAFTWVLGI